MSKQHVVIIGTGVIGSSIAIEALRGGFNVTLIDAEAPGGAQAAGHVGNSVLSAHLALPTALPGKIFKSSWMTDPLPPSPHGCACARFTNWLRDPLKPFSLRPDRFPQALPWLCRYILSGLSWEKAAKITANLYPLLKDSAKLHKCLAQEAGVPRLIEQNGALAVFSSRTHFTSDPQGWTIRRQAGIEWKDLENQDLRGEEPDLSPEFQFAVLIDDAGNCLDPGAYSKALAQHAIASGAVFRQTTATALRIEAGVVKGVYTRSGEIPCDKAVIAAGASSRALARRLGDCVSLETERSYLIEVSGVSAGPRRPLFFDDRNITVSRTENGVRITGQTEIDTLDAPPNWKQADLLLPVLREILPGLPPDIPEGNIGRGMSARPLTPDGLPCLGYASASRDAIHAFGHGRAGFAASARTARLVCQLLNNGEPETDIRPYVPNRFNLL
ncbi:MAG: FAD-binding oxidoreductase [Candidatus Accumulibacter sp.]|jgi:D-amino-acid dehydrogenase|nr:FAD-binding oxidoreductase [Accumulibacter sp.]